MTHKAEFIGSYDFKRSDELLLDANVWLFICAPHKPKDNKVAIYSQAFRKILDAQSHIYIDVLIVSEFINRCARLKWQLVSRSSEFKDFRRSDAFAPVARDIAADVNRVLQHCRRVDDGFESIDIAGLINEYATGNVDFNDQILASLCRRKGLTLVTDDGDFKGQDIPIVTANKRLLG